MYYSQRASAGLIITEGTSPSPNGLGYPRIPGIFSKEQVKAWERVTDAVHKKGGKIIVQLMHVGRIAHPANLPRGAEILAPSAVAPETTQMSDDKGTMMAIPVPKPMTIEDIVHAQDEYVQAAKNAMAAGFDGVELHGANGYLIEQFIHPHTNRRSDIYGGSIEKRIRFALEVAEKTAMAIGKDRVGIRLSPYGVYNDMPHYPEIDKTYTLLAEKLGHLGIAYVHIVDHSSMGAPEVPRAIKKAMRDRFSNAIILTGGYSPESAEKELESELADLIGFGRLYIANPDLPERIQRGLPLSQPDFSTLYTPGEKGYIDYPAYAA
jgi:N-ethylmaleimide reductase